MRNKLLTAFLIVAAMVASSGSVWAQAKKSSAEKRATSSLEMTAAKLYEESERQVTRMQKILEAHRKLLDEATKTGLVVAIEAIDKDVKAVTELLSLAANLLAELQQQLALSDPENANLKIKDPFQYPQVKELRILGDQIENLYRADKKFLESMQKPTELKVTRQDKGGGEE